MTERFPTEAAGSALTAEVRNLLGDLALNAEEHTDLADAYSQAMRELERVVERHPEFRGCSAELRVKLGQLAELHRKASWTITSYAHAYEDARTTPGAL